MKSSFLMHRLGAWTLFFLPGLILVTWSCFFLQLYGSPVLARIQNPHFHWLTLISAGILFLSVLLYPFLFDCNFQISKKSLLRGGLTLMIWSSPLLCFFLVPLKTFTGNRFVQKPSTPVSRSARTDQSGSAHPWNYARPDEMLTLTTLDLLMANDDDEQEKKQIASHTIQVIGQYVPDSGDQFQLMRTVMVCCAADAQPAAIWVHAPPPNARQGEWLEVTGKVTFVKQGEVPFIQADEVQKIPAPSDEYIY